MCRALFSTFWGSPPRRATPEPPPPCGDFPLSGGVAPERPEPASDSARPCRVGGTLRAGMELKLELPNIPGVVCALTDNRSAAWGKQSVSLLPAKCSKLGSYHHYLHRRPSNVYLLAYLHLMRRKNMNSTIRKQVSVCRRPS
jgi:hypothetical protein